MERMDTATAAGFEVTSFLGYFKTLPDHRQAGKVTYPLDEILLLALLAVLAGAEGFTDIARFGEKKLALLRRFRPFGHCWRQARSSLSWFAGKPLPGSGCERSTAGKPCITRWSLPSLTRRPELRHTNPARRRCPVISTAFATPPTRAADYLVVAA